MLYTGSIHQRHMAAYLDQLPADQYAIEQLDRSLIEMAGRVSRSCIRGVVTAILAGDESTADWDVLRNLTGFEQAEILEKGTAQQRAAAVRRGEAAAKQQQFLSRRRREQLQRTVVDAQQSAQRRVANGDDPNAGEQ